MSLYGKLVHLGFDNDDFELQDIGAGPFIANWFSGQAQPSQSEIDAVSQADADAAVENKKVSGAFELSKKDIVLIKWIASRTGGGTAAQIRSELKTIWQNT